MKPVASETSRWQKIGLSQEDLITAFVNRKSDIITPHMTVMPRSSQGWYRLSADLGNIYAPATLYGMVREPVILEALIADKTDLGVPTEPLDIKGPRPRTLGTILAEKRNGILESEDDYEDRTSDWKTYGERFERIPTRREPLVIPEGYPESDVLLKGEPLSQVVETANGMEKDEEWMNEENASRESAIAHEQRRKRRAFVSEKRQMIMQNRINAILARRSEVVSMGRRKRLSIKSCKNPVWSRIAKDLGNVISPKTVYNTATRSDIRELLYLGIDSEESEWSEDEEKTEDDTDSDDSSVNEEKREVKKKRNGSSVVQGKKEQKTDRNDNVSNGFNQIMFEESIRKVLKIIDFTSVVTNCIKEAKEELREEIRAVKEDIRKEIRGMKKYGRIKIIETRNVPTCSAIPEAKKDRCGPLDYTFKPKNKHT